MLVEFLTWLAYFSTSLLIVVISASIIYARWHYGSLENSIGMPAVIKPWFIGGSDPFFYKSVCCEEDIKRVQKHGRVFGMYEGRSPQVFVADPDLIRSIFIKDFDHFYDKRILDYGHPLISEMMDVLPYDKWKVVRTYLSPQLTTGKIKAMSYQMLEAINNWVDKLKAKMDEEDYTFTPKHAFTTLTTDVIARCAFGTTINTFDDPDNIFVKNVKKLSFDDGDANILFTGTFTFPFIASLEPFVSSEVMQFFDDLLKGILKQRRDSGRERINDFVDAMNDMIEKCSTDPEYIQLNIKESTIMGQAMIFLLAGFETTSTTLSLMAFHLAKFPEVQAKLIKEVDEYLERHDGKIEHETVRELVFVNAVMNETLRMHPPLIRIERVCQKDWICEKTGLHIKEGVTVQVPCFAVHYDEKYYSEPYKFKPDRFLPENKDKLNPYAFLAFGQGPHNCIGTRFAKEEIQLTMASIFKHFQFEECPGAELKIKPGRLFINNYGSFSVNLVKRNM
ncbi:cytochrome P450 3A4 [Folsomia candida]|nr:cytochrome P450 3A4 [Folsomia candida]